MEIWELEAREAIRDLVARYNANGDTGRFEQVLQLFAVDATIEIVGQHTYHGREEILTIFTRMRDSSSAPGKSPTYLRHLTGTHQIDIVDRSRATGRSYYQVLTSIGLDHWGRYLDEYRTVDGLWRFARRRITLDGQSALSLLGRE